MNESKRFTGVKVAVESSPTRLQAADETVQEPTYHGFDEPVPKQVQPPPATVPPSKQATKTQPQMTIHVGTDLTGMMTALRDIQNRQVTMFNEMMNRLEMLESDSAAIQAALAMLIAKQIPEHLIVQSKTIRRSRLMCVNLVEASKRLKGEYVDGDFE